MITLLIFILELMKEPVLQDKRQAHVKFCKYSNELIERVSGKHHNANIEASLQDHQKGMFSPTPSFFWGGLFNKFSFLFVKSI